ncbi:SIS domain-containing protein [Candidatus Thioglobus sp.]|nr:SIS domain-containing protein [Candidatus Thioglobus sp.]MDA8872028.1 SIS domain-containing protein [Candidatus Thioglobus sp.]
MKINNIDKMYNDSSNLDDFISGYFDNLNNIISQLNLTSISRFIEEFEDSYENNQTIFVAGNGGSSSTASTMANDIGFDIMKKTGVNKPVKVHALTENSAVITAIANDTGYDNIFLNQLKIHYKDGDKLLVISASGNSKNLILAAEWVKARGGKVIGLLGFTGGELKDICNDYVHIKTGFGEYGPVEDLHLIINHIMAHWLQNKLKIKL